MREFGSRVLLVTGSREFDDTDRVDRALRWCEKQGYATLIHGAARGADRLCAARAMGAGWNTSSFPALWETDGARAGFIRNGVMVAQRPDLVLAFKDTFDYSLSRGGTEHCVRMALSAGLTVKLVCPSGLRPVSYGLEVF